MVQGQGTAPTHHVLAGPAACEGAACRARSVASGRPRGLTAAGSRLCPACVRCLTRGLKRLSSLYAECGELLGGSQRPRGRASGGGPSPTPGLPFNTTAAEARSLILGVLRSWSGLVVEERKIAAPPDTVAALVEFLLRHAAWLAAHEAAADFSEEAARAVRRAKYVIDPSTSRGMRVGECVEPGCAGVLTAVARADGAGPPVEISCAADPAHRWSAQEWMARGSGAPAEGATRSPVPRVRWLSASDISRLWGTASGSVYRHASEQRWRRRTGKGRTYYHEEDVLRSLGTRSTRLP
ncbi:hypothetical protein AB0C59_23635 [Streptomyces sp. NPDC048664]|uniref:hypothetical protein n=1 Tax=Streptomyces sp. NPDC048664 TaxID=3154505 RepID=UPI003432F3D2